MKILKQITFLFFAILLFNSCSDDNGNDIDPPISGDYENGYFVTNEGPFQNGSGSLTFVDDDGTITQNVYKKVNEEDLGNIVQSMVLASDKGYIVVNNSHKVVVVNRYTMEKISIIEGSNINNPRHLVILDNVGYLSNWGDPTDPLDDFIAVIDLITNDVVRTISVGEGPENMVITNTKLFVNLEGGYSQNNEVTAVDLQFNEVDTVITVGEVPNSSCIDFLGTVWVLCGGNPSWTGNETAGRLYKITETSISYYEFGPEDHPEHLTYGDGKLYYNLNGKVYQMDIDATNLPSEALNGFNGYYYTLKFNETKLYATDAGDFASEGTLKVFDIASANLLETITTGIIPGDVDFQ